MDAIHAFGFVVIGRNEGLRLGACLASILTYGVPTIYVDSASTDGSPELAAKLGASVLRLDPSRPMNASRGRGEGFATLQKQFPQCQFVQFVDGDCVLSPGWVQSAVDFMITHEAAAVVCGRRFEAHPDASIYNRLCDEEWNTPCGRVDASGGDSLMRVAALDTVGSFDPTLMASEEPELAARMRAAGWEIWRIDGRMTEHDAAIFHYGAYWRRSLRGGFGLWQAWRRTSKLPRPINGRTLFSALFWMAVLPLAFLTLAAFFRAPIVILAIPGLYLLQIARMAARKGFTDWRNWRSSGLVMSVKSAEFIGAARALLWSRQQSAIEYKRR